MTGEDLPCCANNTESELPRTLTPASSGSTNDQLYYWAKTLGKGEPGISVRDHCLNVGCVAEALIAGLPGKVRALLPTGAATLAALHDVGKITIGFQAKCSRWLLSRDEQKISAAEATLSVSDHALVSQYFLQKRLKASLWAVALGAHHGRPKGRLVQVKLEAHSDWAEAHRAKLLQELTATFGELPESAPVAQLKGADLWLLAGLIAVADWIGSNEAWFSPENGIPVEIAREKAKEILKEIGWPGGGLRLMSFGEAFGDEPGGMQANGVQRAVAEAGSSPGLIIVEGPMGCGKTEAALFAALQLISSGKQRGIYFALPTQVTSNRIHKRIAKFLARTLGAEASLRLAHGNAWLEDDFDIRLRPAHPSGSGVDEELGNSVQEGRSWFASSKQALLAPYGVGTVDQALQGVVAVKHFFVRRFALAGKVVILDEVHSYDIYTGTLISTLIRELLNLGCTVVVLSATLTAARRSELLLAGRLREGNENEYPLVTFGCGSECKSLKPEWRNQREVRLRVGTIAEEEAIAELIERAEAGQQVLWIRNTVIEAQHSYKAIRSSIREGAVRIGLLHSRFPHQRRAELENEWLERLAKDRPQGCRGSILVATQVVEQSVDIDVDFMISDLAPTDMLLQRVGRLWRHQRAERPAEKPEFWVRLPQASHDASVDEVKRALGRSGRVYAPYVLLRTAEVWRQRGGKALNLPGDIRPMLEQTYAEQQAEQEVLEVLKDELEKEKAELVASADAATRVLASRPMLRDEEEVLTRRRGAPTMTIVMVRSVRPEGDQWVTVEALDGSQNRVSNYEWRRASARFLQNWSVRIPRWFVAALPSKPRWLMLHAPAAAACVFVADDGHCIFDNEKSSTYYDTNLGVAIHEGARPSTRTSDDDDEFDY